MKKVGNDKKKIKKAKRMRKEGGRKKIKHNRKK